MKIKKWETLHSNKKQDWETPDDLFNKLNNLYGPFGLDAAATKKNTKCEHYLSQKDDALKQSWHLFNKRIWLNPPYKNPYPWIDKAYRESKMGAKVVCLLPSRTGTRWFQDFMPKASECIFYSGRIKFKGAKYPAPFDSLILIFG